MDIVPAIKPIVNRFYRGHYPEETELNGKEKREF